MKRTKLFDKGRINYSVKYKQYQMEVHDTETGEVTKRLFHEEVAKYYQFPFTFGFEFQWGLCKDTGEYYRS
jgi:hypothetical protein